VKKFTNILFVAHGLLETREEMQVASGNGAIAVSAGNPKLWEADLTDDEVSFNSF
jgi:glycerol-3-phosphate responsive antiterminator